MKKSFFLVAIVMVLASCGASKKVQSQNKVSNTPPFGETYSMPHIYHSGVGYCNVYLCLGNARTFCQINDSAPHFLICNLTR